MKAKLKGAEQGHSLLKRKSEALTKCVDKHSLAYGNLMLTLDLSGVSEVNLR
jgi:vacuolar-type H+-ATPase subunit D/Vma8